MTVSASLLATAVVLCAVGGILMLTRPLTRILLSSPPPWCSARWAAS
ncbi:hypothetical protein [Streptomyces cavourensis]|nr:hypothetical protein [Streptomyces cavourensis]